MTLHVQFPPYLRRGKIDGEPHPVRCRAACARADSSEDRTPCARSRTAHSAANSALEWQCFPAALFSLENGPPPRSVLDVIRRDGVPYPYGEIEHDVIAALIRPPLDPWQEGWC